MATWYNPTTGQSRDSAASPGTGWIDITVSPQSGGTPVLQYVPNSGGVYIDTATGTRYQHHIGTGQILYYDPNAGGGFDETGQRVSGGWVPAPPQIADVIKAQAEQHKTVNMFGTVAYYDDIRPGGGWGGGSTSSYDAGGNLRGSAESGAYLGGATAAPAAPTASSGYDRSLGLVGAPQPLQATPTSGMVWSPQEGAYVEAPNPNIINPQRVRQPDGSYEWYGVQDQSGIVPGGGGGGTLVAPSSGYDRSIQPVGAPQQLSGGGGAGPSAGPSAGPNLSTTFPGYYERNANIEQQYAEWRDARIAANPPQNPYDMAAFRQHLIGINAPDPGAPQGAQIPWTPPAGATPAPSPGTTPAPAGTPSPAGTGPAPVTQPTGGTPAGPTVPAIQNMRPLEQIMASGGLQSMTPAELAYYFPFQNTYDASGNIVSGADPGYASGNLARSFGLNTAVNNPFTQFFTQQAVPGLANTLGNVARASGSPITEGDYLQRLTNAAAQGQMSPFANAGEATQFLKSVGQIPQDTSNPFQQGLLSELSNPNAAYNFMLGSLGGSLAPILTQNRQTQSAVLGNLYDRYRRTSPNQTFFQSLLGGL